MAAVIAIAAVTTMAMGRPDSLPLDPAASTGSKLYSQYCLACHGISGDGQGPGAPLLWPQPRNFRLGTYKWRTTLSGSPPTDLDLQKTILYGVPGTSMHGFHEILTPAQIDEIIKILKNFNPRKFSKAIIKVPFPTPQFHEADRSASETKGKALFETLGCIQCHGKNAAGDGKSSETLIDDQGYQAAPYDLRTVPMRRPLTPDDNITKQIYLSLVTGLDGSPMPAYQGAASEAELWAVASYVQSILPPKSPESLNNSGVIPKQARELAAKNKSMKAGYYPGHGSSEEMSLFGGEIAPQGLPSKNLSPAQGSLDAKQCARCHNKQYREWGPSVHASAGSPGLIAQLLAMERQGTDKSFAKLQSCQRCHNPLAEQRPVLPAKTNATNGNEPYTKNSNYSSNLRDQGLNCASCHVRNTRRFGPPVASDNRRLALPGYPLTELAIYERSDFCMPCHQLPSQLASVSTGGMPLLNTYKEWLEGPYMRRGVQCQHCHMPDREHTWKGIHDPETFRQGIDVRTLVGRGNSGTVSVRVRVQNVGAGHYLPTTPTPAAWVSIQLVDAQRVAVNGAFAEKRIGRHLKFAKRMVQIEDTRIPPGESLELARAWKDGRVSEATHVRVEIRVEPDEYYERFYKQRLHNQKLPLQEREMFTEALRRSRASKYVAQVQYIEIKKHATNH